MSLDLSDGHVWNIKAFATALDGVPGIPVDFWS